MIILFPATMSKIYASNNFKHVSPQTILNCHNIKDDTTKTTAAAPATEAVAAPPTSLSLPPLPVLPSSDFDCDWPESESEPESEFESSPELPAL